MDDLLIPTEQLQQIGAHLTACLPEEACGLIGGTGRRAGLVLPVENQLHSRVRFQMAVQAQFNALVQIETAGMELLAIFHSHPTGPVHPSPTDVAEFYYPGTLVLIASPLPWKSSGLRPDALSLIPEGALAVGTWQIQGFQIIKPIKSSGLWQSILAVKLSRYE